jgi:hypothetical protein
MNLNQKTIDFESRKKNAKMFSILFNTSINRKHINDNSRAMRATRAFFVVTKKQKQNDNDTSNVVDNVNDFDAANKIEKDDDDDEFARSERDVDEMSISTNDDEVVRRETNVDEDFFRDAFRDRDAFEKRKRI